jgi:hypothetical protein
MSPRSEIEAVMISSEDGAVAASLRPPANASAASKATPSTMCLVLLMITAMFVCW